MMKAPRFILLLLQSCLFLNFSISLHARYKMGAEQPVKADDSYYERGEIKPHKTSATPRFKKFPTRKGQKIDETPVLKQLSDDYGVEFERLKYYRQLHFGYEEIVPALIVAREAKVEVGRVLKDRMDGKTWKKIAGDFHVDLEPLNKEVIATLKPIRKSVPQKYITERPQTRQTKE